MIRDLTLTELSSRGFNISTYLPHQFVINATERRIELSITQRALCMSVGMEKHSSAIDTLVPQNNKLVISGVRYYLEHGTLQSESFQTTHRVYQPSENGVMPSSAKVLPLFRSSKSSKPMTLSKYADFNLGKSFYGTVFKLIFITSRIFITFYSYFNSLGTDCFC